jgi:hypothetical protein
MKKKKTPKIDFTRQKRFILLKQRSWKKYNGVQHIGCGLYKGIPCVNVFVDLDNKFPHKVTEVVDGVIVNIIERKTQ